MENELSAVSDCLTAADYYYYCCCCSEKRRDDVVSGDGSHELPTWLHDEHVRQQFLILHDVIYDCFSNQHQSHLQLPWNGLLVGGEQ